MRSVVPVAFVGLTACLSPTSVACGERVCPENTVCIELAAATGDPHRCVAAAAVEACTGVAALGACTVSGVTEAACYATMSGEVCLASGCGNGLIDTGEACDDANALVGDGCSAACRSKEICGNGIVDAVKLADDGSLVPNEVCDDSNALGHDACTSSCVDEQATWAELDSGDLLRPGRPQPRIEAPLVYDALRRRIVLFGGATHNRRIACDTCVDGGPVAQGNTWESDGANWVDMRPPHEPTARHGVAMAYDAARSVSVMFGGNDGVAKDDTWLWNGQAWAQLAPALPLPPARYRHGMAYDGRRKVVVMFGGRGAADSLLADTWEWDGTAWHQASPAASPTPEEALGMTYDPVRGVIVMIGLDASYMWATWEYDGSTWTEKVTNDDTPEVTSLAFDSLS